MVLSIPFIQNPYINPNRISYQVGVELEYLDIADNNTEIFLRNDIWVGLDEGLFIIYFKVYDLANNVNNTYVLTLYKDTTGPIVEVLLPEDSSYHKDPPIFKVIATDPNLHTIWYKIDTEFAPLMNNTEQALNLAIWNGIAEGGFTVEFYANDSFGYISSLVTLNLVKDITIPLITIN